VVDSNVKTGKLKVVVGLNSPLLTPAKKLSLLIPLQRLLAPLA